MLETTSDSKSGPEFVEKFFTERELHVLDEKSGTGEVDKDRFDEWFREVEKTFKKLPPVSYTHLTLPTILLV